MRSYGDFGIEELSLGSRLTGEFPLIEATGDLTASTAQRLRLALFRLIDAGADAILVDVRQIRFIDSAGLGVLLQGQRRLYPGPGSISLVGPSARTREILEVTRLSRVLSVFETEDEAVRALQARLPIASG